MKDIILKKDGAYFLSLMDTFELIEKLQKKNETFVVYNTQDDIHSSLISLLSCYNRFNADERKENYDLDTVIMFYKDGNFAIKYNSDEKDVKLENNLKRLDEEKFNKQIETISFDESIKIYTTLSLDKFISYYSGNKDIVNNKMKIMYPEYMLLASLEEVIDAATDEVDLSCDKVKQLKK